MHVSPMSLIFLDNILDPVNLTSGITIEAHKEETVKDHKCTQFKRKTIKYKTKNY